MIASGERAPGERLVQLELAGELGVSQGVVREALIRLQAAGLVDITPGLGAVVTRIDAASVLDACRVREMLEGMAARLCCESISRQDLAALRRLAAGVDAAGEKGEIEQMARLDQQFHQRIVALAGNPLLTRLANAYRTLAKAIRTHQEGEMVSDRHVELLQPIERNEPDAAEWAMREHVRRGTVLLRQRLEDQEGVDVAQAAWG